MEKDPGIEEPVQEHGRVRKLGERWALGGRGRQNRVGEGET